MAERISGTHKLEQHLDQSETLEPIETTQDGEAVVHDAVFGEISERGPNYRNVGWLGTVAIMVKTQIGLGVLSIPSAFDVLGIVPGTICLVAIVLMNTWSSYIVGVFKVNHPEVYGIDDMGSLLFGRIGREFFAVAFCIYWILNAGSGMLGMSICLNAISVHGACTAIFVAITCIVVFGLASIQTLGRISWLAWMGITCLFTAIFTLTIAVGVQDRPADAPQTGPWKSDYKISGNPSFPEAATALSTFLFANAATPAFFSIVSEMREPRHYTRSLLVCQAIVCSIYVAVGCVVYYYCGSYVASPALGSAGPLLKKICYGFALPGLTVSTTLLTHFPSKFIFVRLLRGTKHLNQNTFTHWVTWFGAVAVCALLAYIIASAVPVFNNLVSLVGALLGPTMAYIPMAGMWFYDNRYARNGPKRKTWIGMAIWCVFIIVSGVFLTVSGTYGSILDLIDTYNGGSAAWSCADNSNSVK